MPQFTTCSLIMKVVMMLSTQFKLEFMLTGKRMKVFQQSPIKISDLTATGFHMMTEHFFATFL